jgi:4-hydroxy-4-methyl-2-oxoglutarate aldolase
MSMFEVNETIERTNPELVKALAGFPVANISDAMANLHTMDSGLNALVTGDKICGPAITVSNVAGDIWATLKTMATAQPGDIMVIDSMGAPDTAQLGEILVSEAKRRGIAGMVIDGLIRDCDGIRKMGFPIFNRGSVPRVAGASKLGEVNVPVSCGGIVVLPGDVIIGDEDGLVVVPRRKAEIVLKAVRATEAYEEELIAKVSGGTNLVEIANWDEKNREMVEAKLPKD